MGADTDAGADFSVIRFCSAVFLFCAFGRQLKILFEAVSGDGQSCLSLAPLCSAGGLGAVQFCAACERSDPQLRISLGVKPSACPLRECKLLL